MFRLRARFFSAPPGAGIEVFSSPRFARSLLLLWLASLFLAGRCQAQLSVCDEEDQQEINRAVGRIEAAIDPCGESAQLRAILDTVTQCRHQAYEVCTDRYSSRSVFDRPTGMHGEPLARTISWNPILRSTLEEECADDPTMAVQRDPTASLLHELVHAADDCQGRNPGEHELEAVRIENIYRRAAGLCQRARYGDEELPRQWRKSCAPHACACADALPSSEPLQANSRVPLPLSASHDPALVVPRGGAGDAVDADDVGKRGIRGRRESGRRDLKGVATAVHRR